MRQPSLVLHSHDVPGYRYQMWKTAELPRGVNAMNVVNWIHWGIEHSPELYLHNVIINCHGAPGALLIGGDGSNKIECGNVGVFNSLRQKGAVGTIWLVACRVAENSGMGYPKWFLGPKFCSALAQAAGCEVAAADVKQRVDVPYNYFYHPFGTIDDFEGKVYRFSPGSEGHREEYIAPAG